MSLVLAVLWLSLPVVAAGVAHMVVVKRRLFAPLAVPLDGGRTLGGLPIFGPNKTWRGVVVMIAAAAAFGWAQGALLGPWAARAGLECVDYAAAGRGSTALGYLTVNLLLGAGYVLGELPNSFLKRRAGVAAGGRGAGLWGWAFRLLDQVDSVVVALVLGALVFRYPWRVVGVGTVLLAGVHLAVTATLHRARLKESV